jgi:hypothetical protein
MKMPRAWHAVSGRAMNLARRYPRGTLITGALCLVLAFLPYYSHTASDGPAEVDLFLIGKVKGPPERTFFHIGLPWSPWVRYWRVLEYQGPFAFNYQYGHNWNTFNGSALLAAFGVVVLVVGWIARQRPAPRSKSTALHDGGSSDATAPVESAPG